MPYISERGKTLKFSEKFLMLKDIHFYLWCLVLNGPVTVLGKKLVLNLRLTLCILKMSLRGGVPWVFSAKDSFTTLATDWSMVDCVSWLGGAGHCAFIASATASCTVLENEAREGLHVDGHERLLCGSFSLLLSTRSRAGCDQFCHTCPLCRTLRACIRRSLRQ